MSSIVVSRARWRPGHPRELGTPTLGVVGRGGILVATPPLYPAYAEQSVRLFGISPALDQRLAGLVMIGEQVASLALCFAFLLPALRQEAPSRTVLQRAADWASPLAA
jgi:hypothetical protein